MSGRYDGVGNDRLRAVRDHTAMWNRLRPITDPKVRAEVEPFCSSRRITVEALAELGTRAKRHHDFGWCLAYAGMDGNGGVVAIKYRPINGTSHDSFAEEPSTWLRPIVIGNRNSLDWLIVEGETDAARLYGLVGDRCAILVLPTGARTFRREWADVIPRGALVALCHDADGDGDAGAGEAARIVGGRIVRVRPPLEGADWCDWDGDRDAFLKLAKPRPRFEFETLAEFRARQLPVAEPLLGKRGKVFIATGCLFLVYGADGCGKSTWTIDGVVHLAAGADWLGIPVPRPVRVLVIENEGPAGLFQQKLEGKLAAWDGADPTGNLFVLAGPWGKFTFADAGARAELTAYCEENRIELVAANPTLGLGVGTSGRPDETAEFVEWLVECGMWTSRAFWLNHHENKLGKISGDWGRHPDTYAWLQRDGNRQRTKLTWVKPRWATLEPDEKAVMLNWVTGSWGYDVTPIEPGGGRVSDEEYDERINAFLIEHPGATTTRVTKDVKGRAERIRERLRDGDFDSYEPRPGTVCWLPPGTGRPT